MTGETAQRKGERAPSESWVPALDRVLGWTLSVADRRPGLSILLFHRVLPAADPYRPGDLTAEQFEAVAGMLARNFAVMPLDEGIERLGKNALPPAALSITFDDGYRDNLDVAAPILAARGMVATFFVATGFLDGGWMFNDRIIEACKATTRTSAKLPVAGLEAMDLGAEQDRVAAAHAIISNVKYLPVDQRSAMVDQLEDQLEIRLQRGPMLDPTGVRRLRELGMTIGAHTVTHPILAKVDHRQARTEIFGSRTYLSELLREPIRLFAYPNGRPGQDYRPEHMQIVVEAGFASAVNTSPCIARPDMSAFELPRFTPWDKTAWRFGARLALTRMSVL